MATFFALAAVALAFGGCTPPKSEGGRAILQPRTVALQRGQANLYRLQLFYVTEQLEGEEQPADLWRLFDQTVVPSAKRRLLAENGLRLALSGELAMKRFDALVAGNRGIQVQRVPDVYAYQGYALDAPCGAAQQDMALLYTQADGSVTGRDFLRGSTILRIQPLASSRPGGTDLVISEWIVHGNPQPNFTRTPTGLMPVSERPRFWFTDLETRVPLAQDQVLAVGLEPGHALSIGDHLFVSVKPPYRYVSMILVYPELVAAGAVPRDTQVVGSPTGAGGPLGPAPPAN
jgi:hypothetical protein